MNRYKIGTLFLSVFLITLFCFSSCKKNDGENISRANSSSQKTSENSKSSNKNSMEDIKTADAESVLSMLFSTPDEKMKEALRNSGMILKDEDDDNNSKNRKSLNVNPSAYIKDRYQKYFTKSCFDEFAKKYLVIYQGEAADENKKMTMGKVKFEKSDEGYNFEVQVKYGEHQTNKTAQVSVNIKFMNGKISDFCILSDEGLADELD